MTDDADIPLGTPEEALLKAALVHIDTGNCPPGTASTSNRGVQSLDLRSASSAVTRFAQRCSPAALSQNQ